MECRMRGDKGAVWGRGGWSEARVSQPMTQGAALIRRMNTEERGPSYEIKGGSGGWVKEVVLFPMKTAGRRNKHEKATV